MTNSNVTIKLKSNIILKSIYQKHKGDMTYFIHLPIDLLSKEYRDVRSFVRLSETQQEEIYKRLYYAERVKDIENVLEDSDYELLGLNSKSNKIETIDEIEKSLSHISQLSDNVQCEIIEVSSEPYQETNSKESEKICECNPIINSVLIKYQYEKTYLERIISDVVSELDTAIKYLKEDNRREVIYSIDKIRELYKKMMHHICDHLCNKNTPNFGFYFKPMSRLDLEKMFVKNNIDKTLINRLSEFHELANAGSHIGDKGTKRFSNKNIIENFFNLPMNRREEILLSIPKFLVAINLTNSEKKLISQKLAPSLV